MTGKIKVSILRHKREKKSDTKIAWEMFRKIYHIYSETRNKEGKCGFAAN